MAKSKKPIRRKFHTLRFLTILLAIVVGFEVVGGVVGYVGLQMFLKDTPEFHIEDFTAQQSTLVFDADGNQIADVGTQLRENITYDQIPESLVDAFLSIEDSRYFAHNGFDLPRFTKSIIETIIHHNMQGGSTFTMQLVKLTYFVDDNDGTSYEKTINYKFQQIALALQLEKAEKKKEIFALYLNKMNFGGIGNIRGVQKASQQYFGKDVSELNLAESALLAGVVNSPYYYDPHYYLDHAIKRRNTVLDLMVYHGYISKEEGELAKAIPVENLITDPKDSMQSSGYQYQAYIDTALQEAAQVTGLDPLNVSMEIHTAMDPEVQSTMEAIQANEIDSIIFPDDLMEVAMISENNQTGEIVGIGGGRNWASGGSALLNHATQQFNQPGSSIKPIVDYALAFEYLGWATDHILVDKPITYGNWTYKNFGGSYRGRVTLKDAVGNSLNTTALQALQQVIDKIGQDAVINYLYSIGFDRFKPEQFDIGFAIGGNNFYASTMQLMAANAVLMNGGHYIKPHTIKKIVYRDGSLEDYVAPTEGTQVLSPQAAYLTAYLMHNNIWGPYYNYMQILKRSYATYAKTGTTDYGTDGLQYGIPRGAAKEKWMVAQSTQFTTAVWVGYEKAIEGEGTYFSSYKSSLNIPGKIQSALLDVLHRNGDPEDLARPDGISDITHISGVFPYVKPTETTPSDYITTGMIKSEFDELGTYEEMIEPVDNLASFHASYDARSKLFNVEWASYPNAEKLSEKTGDDVTFDISWITGPIRYKARIAQNGKTLGEISSEGNTTAQTVAGLQGGQEAQVCGYYGYANTADSSNEVCINVQIPKFEVKVPAYNSVEEYQAWAKENGISLVVTKNITNDPLQIGVIHVYNSNGKDVINGTVEEGTTLYLTAYEKAKNGSNGNT